MENFNESLKNKSKEWWSNHSQDYVNEGEQSHTGAKTDLNDTEFLQYLDKLDSNFKRQAYFAQKRGDSLFADLLPDVKNKQVLEVGCGLGSHSEALARAGANLTSIDLSPTSIEVTKRRFQLKGLNAQIMQADAEKLPFDDNSFDVVWSWGVIHHSPNTVACAKEITRVLKPGGKVAIMLYHRHSMYNWINVILRYGILQGKLLKMSIQELHNRYTDGKHLGGAPLSKYYTRKQIANDLFPGFVIEKQIAFEQKKAVSFIIPAKFRNKFEEMIPDCLYTWLFSKAGFMIFTVAKKP